jgi:hypothetical protein
VVAPPLLQVAQFNILKDGSRHETTTSYMGGAGHATDATYMEGEYMPSKHIDLGAVPIQPAYRTNAGGEQMRRILEINPRRCIKIIRSTGSQETIFGAFGGAIGAAISPSLDALRPSRRRENTIGTLRPYQNLDHRIEFVYFNPADKPAQPFAKPRKNQKDI